MDGTSYELTMRRFPVHCDRICILVHLVEDELLWVALILQQIECVAAFLGSAALGVDAHGLQERRRPVLLNLHLHDERNRLGRRAE